MGCFSWMYCDKKRKNGKPLNLRIGGIAYIPFPKEQGGCGFPPGHQLVEKDYDGYGRFAGVDIFDLVVDWNKEYISSDNIRIPQRDNYSNDAEGEKFYQAAMSRYKEEVERLNDFISGLSDEEMTRKYSRFWKRELGIDIACYDEQNAALKYPIKICRYKKSVYEDMPPSDSDPNQGCF